MKAYIKLKGDVKKAIDILRKYSKEILAVVDIEDVVKITTEAIENNLALEIVPIQSKIEERKRIEKTEKKEKQAIEEGYGEKEERKEETTQTLPTSKSERIEEIEKELSNVLVKDEYTIGGGEEEVEEEEEVEYDLEERKII